MFSTSSHHFTIVLLDRLLYYRWNRLENLLVQGRQDREFVAKDALQPVLKLLLGPDGESLRVLVVKEAVRVTEAITFGTLIDSYNAAPEFLKPLISSGNPAGPFKLSDVEREQMMELRGRVLRIWGLLRSSDSFDPSLLQPIVQVRYIFIPFIGTSAAIENSATHSDIDISGATRARGPCVWFSCCWWRHAAPCGSFVATAAEDSTYTCPWIFVVDRPTLNHVKSHDTFCGKKKRSKCNL
jgi:hypothetical protein